MRAREFITEDWDDDEEGDVMRLHDQLSYPEVVDRISGMMRAMGWKVRRKGDDDYIFLTRGQLEDEWYTVSIGKTADGKGFTYALGTIEEGDPHIGQQEAMPNTVASVSMLADEIRDGFGMNENSNVDEASYPGNIGAMEVAKFFQKATPEQRDTLKKLIKSEDYSTAWQLIQKVTGVKLQGKEFATNEQIEETIRKQGDKYVIYSKDGKKKLGTYDSRKAAEKRLGQIEYFKHAGK